MTLEDKVEKNQKINLEDQQVKKISNNFQKQTRTYEIQNKPLNLNLSEQKLEISDDKSATSIVENVHSEINREEKVISVDDQQRKTSKLELSKLHPFISDFQGGFKLISNFQGEGTNSRSSITPVDKKHRIAFRKFYESFDSLSSEGKKLLDVLIEASGDYKLPNSYNKPKYSSREVSKALQRINWDGLEVEFKSRSLGKKRKNSSDGNYGWGNWENNPFRFFYENENDWREKVVSHDSATAALESYMNNMRFPCLGSTLFGPKMVETCYSSKSGYESKVKRSRGEIEQHISKWMLDQMRYSL